MYTARPTRHQLDAQAVQPVGARLAHQMIAKLPANVEVDDLIQVGMIGLTDALSRYDAAQGVQFETFATQRIRGAMLDELRGNDWMSRGDRRKPARDRGRAAPPLNSASAARRPRARSRRRWASRSPSTRSCFGKRCAARSSVYLEGHVRRRGDDDFHGPPRRRREADPLSQLRDHQRMRQASSTPSRPCRAKVRDEMYYEHDMNLKDCRRAQGHRVARVPAAQPVDRPFARQAARVVMGRRAAACCACRGCCRRCSPGPAPGRCSRAVRARCAGVAGIRRGRDARRGLATWRDDAGGRA